MENKITAADLPKLEECRDELVNQIGIMNASAYKTENVDKATVILSKFSVLWEALSALIEKVEKNGEIEGLPVKERASIWWEIILELEADANHLMEGLDEDLDDYSSYEGSDF